MADAYIGQIEIFGFGFAPRGWAFCAGQLLAISQNQALFAILGTTYGGDGIRTFALPDLRGRLGMGQGQGPGLSPRSMGQTGGEPNHTLLISETPSHTHNVGVATKGNVSNNTEIPGPTVVLATTSGKLRDGNALVVNAYAADTSPNQPMAPDAIGATGGQPHSNMMPYLGLNFCICLQGVFPSQN